jgi:hypothetical protein
MAELNVTYGAQFDLTPMTVKDWFLTIFILAIPFVNIVMYLVWAFGSSGNLNRRNFCRATLLWVAILFIAYSLFLIIFGGAAYLKR